MIKQQSDKTTSSSPPPITSSPTLDMIAQLLRQSGGDVLSEFTVTGSGSMAESTTEIIFSQHEVCVHPFQPFDGTCTTNNLNKNSSSSSTTEAIPKKVHSATKNFAKMNNDFIAGCLFIVKQEKGIPINNNNVTTEGGELYEANNQINLIPDEFEIIDEKEYKSQKKTINSLINNTLQNHSLKKLAPIQNPINNNVTTELHWYVIWVPYGVLLSINPRLVPHQTHGVLWTGADYVAPAIGKPKSATSNPQIPTSNSNQSNNQNPFNIPTFLNRFWKPKNSNDSEMKNLNDSETEIEDDNESNTYSKKGVGLLKLNNIASYAFCQNLTKCVHSIKQHQKEMGWSFMNLTIKNNSNSNSNSETLIDLAPFFFHGGGCSRFFKFIQEQGLAFKSKSNSNLYIIKNDSISNTEFPMPSNSNSSTENKKLFEFKPQIPKELEKKLFPKKKSPTYETNSEDVSEEGTETILKEDSLSKQQQPQIPMNSKNFDLVNSLTEIPNFDSDSQKKDDVSKLKASVYIEHFQIPTIHPSTPLPPIPPKKSNSDSDSEDEIPEIDSVGMIDTSSIPLQRLWDLPKISMREWNSYFNSETGSFHFAAGKKLSTLERDIFVRGISDDVRPIAWKYLLGIWDYSDTNSDKLRKRKLMETEYYNVKKQWELISPRQTKNFSSFSDRKIRIEKDVTRTDTNVSFFTSENVSKMRDILLTFAFFNFDLAYCQGMADYLSPIMEVFGGDEVDSFWGFVGIMENRKIEDNFRENSESMKNQLCALSNLVSGLDYELYIFLEDNDSTNFFFCFRWILVQFKREFGYSDIKRLWEGLWSNYLNSYFHLFVCYAILKKNRSRIMKCNGFDEILQICNSLVAKDNKNELIEILKLATKEFFYYKEKTERRGGANPQ